MRLGDKNNQSKNPPLHQQQQQPQVIFDMCDYECLGKRFSMV